VFTGQGTTSYNGVQGDTKYYREL